MKVGCVDSNALTKSVKEAVESYIEIKREEVDDYEYGSNKEDKLMHISMRKVLDNIKN